MFYYDKIFFRRIAQASKDNNCKKSTKYLHNNINDVRIRAFWG